MMTNLQHYLRKFPWIAIGAIWIMLWLFPWQKPAQQNYPTGAQAIIDFASMGIAFLLFIFPGLGLTLVLTRGEKRFGIPALIASGFAISVFIAGALGILAKVIAAPLGFVVWGLFAAGLGALIFLNVFNIPFPAINRAMLDRRATLTWLLIALAVLICLAFAFNTSMDTDDTSYLAYLNRWRSAESLNFVNTIYGFETPESVRFWFAAYPLALGALANLGGLPSLLAYAILMPPFLAILSLISMYALARRFSFSREASAWVLLLYHLFMGLISKQPGFSYWVSGLGQDKLTAALILFPVALNLILAYWIDPRRPRLILAVIMILALAVTHPVVLSIAALITGLIFLLSFERSKLLPGIIVLAFFAASMIPFAYLREIESSAGHLYSYTVDDLELTGKGDRPGTRRQISFLPDGSFYSLNPDRLRLNFPAQDSHPWIDWLSRNSWYILAGLTALKALTQFRSDLFARYALAVIVITALCLIPYTAWLIGFLITPPLISRVLWFFPYGFVLVYLFTPWKHFSASAILAKPAVMRGALGVFAVLFAVIVIPPFFTQPPAVVQDYRTYRNLISAGDMLDANIRSGEMVLGSRFVNDFIPGITLSAPVITFRSFVTPASSQMFSTDQLDTRLADRDAMLALDTPWNTRVAFWQKYNTRFVLIDAYANKETAKLFDDLSAQHPQALSLVWSEKRYRIYEIVFP